jgi:hypothetical protein
MGGADLARDAIPLGLGGVRALRGSGGVEVTVGVDF